MFQLNKKQNPLSTAFICHREGDLFFCCFYAMVQLQYYNLFILRMGLRLGIHGCQQ